MNNLEVRILAFCIFRQIFYVKKIRSIFFRKQLFKNRMYFLYFVRKNVHRKKYVCSTNPKKELVSNLIYILLKYTNTYITLKLPLVKYHNVLLKPLYLQSSPHPPQLIYPPLPSPCTEPVTIGCTFFEFVSHTPFVPRKKVH